jgi:iturin family lipopeptide synthetase A
MVEQPERERLALQRAASTIKSLRHQLDQLREAIAEPIAVMSAACRLPGGISSPEKFWDLLLEGRETRDTVPLSRWDPEELVRDCSHEALRYGHFLDQIDAFDAQFFGITPKEARAIDPQHRILLEVAWEAFERAGRIPKREQGERTGVFVGVTSNDYGHIMERTNDISLLNAYFVTGNPLNAAAGRIAYTFGLRGPAIAFDTACSSSLVALHHACQSLRSKECDQALVGGVNIILSPGISISLAQASMLAPDGRCKTFSEDANGYARGEGCVAVLLKRLSDALRDGDPVMAVIRGSAVNQDGPSSGFTVPSGLAQRALIQQALTAAGLPPREIHFVEAHGTGTPLGDPIEVRALQEVFSGDRQIPLYIGSLKSNIGHLESAAGIAAFLKVILALKHRKVPATLHASRKNSALSWDSSVVVADSSVTLPDDTVLRAGVSSFGASGTNAHVVVEQAPGVQNFDEIAPERSCSVVALSAKTESSLIEVSHQVKGWIQQQALSVSDKQRELIAWSNNTARPHSHFRRAILLSGQSERVRFEDVIASTDPRAVLDAQRNGLKITFFFTGQGSQYAGMGRTLYEKSRSFRAALDECVASVSKYSGDNLLELLFQDEDSTIHEAQSTQLALFAYEYAAARMWQAYGIVPTTLVGHSIGEVAAAVIADGLSLEDGVQLVVHHAASSHLSYSSAFDEVCTRFSQQISHLTFRQPQLQIVSTLTGKAITTEMSSPDYWVQQLRQPVNFPGVIETALSLSSHALIEVGPQPVLTGLVRSTLLEQQKAPPLLLSSGEDAADSWQIVCTSVAQLFCHGATIAWNEFHEVRGPRLPMPTYPFERERFWFATKADQNLISPVVLPRKGELIPMTTSKIQLPSSSHIDRLTTVTTLLSRVTGIEKNRLDPDMNLFEVGVDSLMLIEFQQSLQRECHVHLELQDFTTTFDTLRKVSEILDESSEEVQPSEQRHSGSTFVAHSEQNSSVAAIFNQQLQLLQQHQQTLTQVIEQQIAALQGSEVSTSNVSRNGATHTPAAVRKASEIKGLYGAKESQADSLTAAQRAHLTKLITRYRAKTTQSWRYAEQSRHGAFAHNRNSFFRREFKDLTYLIAYDKAEGAHFTDIDGNRYLDITMGFGVHLLGHNPQSVKDALAEEVQRGVAVGPVSRHAGEVAELIHDLTGSERVAFFNTGSEAVMVAIRLARAVTGRDKIVIFSGSWHGSFDGVLASGYTSGGEVSTYPMAPGTTAATVADVIVLRYGDPKALESLAQLGSSIAAVLVEPVQSRNPSLQPREFVTKLRSLTEEHGCVLLFDEMITGFRIAPGGAKEWYGVEPDIMTYGKIVGAGQPVGVVGGKRIFLDALDGGVWSFGDESMPSVQPTLVAGTFNIHPLTMAAARAVLREIKEGGGKIQTRLNKLTGLLCNTLNDWFVEEGYPIRMNFFGSLFRFDISAEYELLYYHLIDRGIFVWEGRNCFLSAAHTEADVQQIISAVQDSLHEMRQDDWIPGDVRRQPQKPLPLWRGQQELRVYLDAHPEKSTAFYESCLLELKGDFQHDAFEKALRACCWRHELLRARLTSENTWSIDTEFTVPLVSYDVGAYSVEEREALEQDTLLSSFDLERGYGWRIALFRESAATTRIQVVAHHLIIDGWGLGVFASELAALYHSFSQRETLELPKSDSYRKFIEWDFNRSTSADQVAYWQRLIQQPLPSWEACDRKMREATPETRGERIRRVLGEEQTLALQESARKQGTGLYALLLAATATILRRIGQQDRFLIGCPVALQAASGFSQLIGQATVILPLDIECRGGQSFAEFARTVHQQVLTAQAHEPGLREVQNIPSCSVVVNLDRRIDFSFGDLTTTVLDAPIGGAKVGLFVNAITVGSELILDVDYDADLYTSIQVESWVEAIEKILSTSGQFLERSTLDSFGTLLPLPDRAHESFIRRGDFRVYLSEVAGQLKNLPQVRDAVAVICEGSTINGALLVGIHATVEWSDEIARAITLQVPALYRPTYVSSLGSCPQTDRKDQEEWLRNEFQSGRLQVFRVQDDRSEPQTADEEIVAAVVQEVLGVPAPMNSSFSELGGRSLAALEVVTRLTQRLNREISLATLVRSDTLREFVLSITQYGSQGSPQRSVERIEPRDPKTIVPLSHPQERLWILHEHFSSQQAYILSRAFWLAGDLDIPLLCKAFEAVVARHEALRTRIRQNESGPIQEYCSPEEFSVRCLRSAADTETAKVRAVQEIYEREIATPFDLETGPLLRVTLVDCTDRWFLSVVLHHLVGDGWSEGILIKEVTEYYQARKQGRTPEFVLLPVNYGDYALWQRGKSHDKSSQEFLDRMQDRLADAPDILNLPTDKPRPSVQNFAGSKIVFTLDAGVGSLVRQYARRTKTSPFAILASAYATLLSLYSGDTVVTLGVPLANRMQRETKDLIGFFVTTGLVVCPVARSDSFEGLVRDVMNQTIDLLEHQDVTFEEVVERVRPKRAASYNPLCQTFFSLQEFAHLHEMPVLPGITFAPAEVETSAGAKFDLSLEFEERNGIYQGTCEFATALFEEDTIRQLLRHFNQILKSALNAPGRRVTTHSLLVPGEEAQIVAFQQGASLSYPADASLATIFEEAVQSWGDRHAVSDQDGVSLSFDELNQMANQFGHLLISKGGLPGSIIGVAVSPSTEAVALMLAVLKIGSTIVPLDPSYPTERLAYMIRSATPSLVVTESPRLFFSNDQNEASQPVLIDFAAMRTARYDFRTTNPGRVDEPAQNAYLVFTSGSTGQPKGVGIHHRGILNRCAWMWQEFPFEQGEVCLQRTSYSFVDALWETFGPLLQGVPLVVADSDTRKNSRQLAQLIKARQITRIVVVPSLLNELLIQGEKNTLSSLRLITSSGEALTTTLAHQTLKLLPATKLLNLYGQSEATADCLAYLVTGVEQGDLVPLGSPLANVSVSLVDEEGRTVPFGMMGELCVGGVGVTCGYLNQPEETAQRFHRDQNGDEAGLLFSTGDKARLRLDGNYMFHGRVDHQVKVRGFRIETEEIARVIRQQTGVRQCIVDLRTDTGVGSQLVAYVEGDKALLPELRQKMRQVLPDYMMPGAFMILDHFPLTPNGKLDRRALPSPDLHRFVEKVVVPSTPIEKRLVRVCSELLGLPEVGLDQDFFDLGGHSLLATRVLNRIKDEWGVAVSLQEFFREPTVGALAALVTEREHFEAGERRVGGRL